MSAAGLPPEASAGGSYAEGSSSGASSGAASSGIPASRAEAPGVPVPSAVGEGLKAAFRTHPAGVAIITAATAEGPVGLTASSVASVAVDPAAIVFSVTRATGSAGGLLSADTFVVHLIDDDHSALAQSFAVSGSERFTPEQQWSTLPTGEPYLPAARFALRCRAIQVVPVGTSSVVIAEVLEVFSGPQGRPLVYVDRRFHTLSHPS